jgi:hypothetical protein
VCALRGLYCCKASDLLHLTVMMNFLWDLHQHGQISEARADAAQAKSDASQQMERVRELEFSLQRMALVSQALWELLRSRLGLTEEELIAAIKEIDLRDGKLDGRMAAQRMNCPSCERVVSSKHSRCIYCGTAVARPHVFQ